MSLKELIKVSIAPIAPTSKSGDDPDDGATSTALREVCGKQSDPQGASRSGM
jgi:hypothetical protein